jgi:hypothetical protein
MSRTPVGEALQSLLREGYLEELLCRGLAAPRRTLDGLRQFFELREVLEAAASRYADLRALRSESDQFKVLCTRYEGEANLNTWNQMSLPPPPPPLAEQRCPNFCQIRHARRAGRRKRSSSPTLRREPSHHASKRQAPRCCPAPQAGFAFRLSLSLATFNRKPSMKHAAWVLLITAAALCAPVCAAGDDVALFKSVTARSASCAVTARFKPARDCVVDLGPLVPLPRAPRRASLKDGTRLTLGPGSELLVRDYVFEPRQARYAFSVHLAKGQAIYSSGKIGKLAPGSVKVSSPMATVGCAARPSSSRRSEMPMKSPLTSPLRTLAPWPAPWRLRLAAGAAAVQRGAYDCGAAG